MFAGGDFGAGDARQRPAEQRGVDVAEEEQDGAEGLELYAAVVELPLELVVADSRWNCRTHTEEDIEKAMEMFSEQPMFHTPIVAPIGDGRYQLVAGFLRFEVLRRQGHEACWFRVVEGTETDLYLWNLAENTARRALKSHELVERVWMLHSRGIAKAQLAQACGFGVRYINRLLFIRRRAHPELYTLFQQEHPRLTIPRMARLVGHAPEQQMSEFRRSEAHLEQATVIEQGYSESPPPLDAESSEPPEASGYEAPGSREARRARRRRLPRRSHVVGLLRMHRRASNLHPEYRRAAIAVLEHLLTGEPLPERLSLESDTQES